jgi:hypothetical protein
MMGLTAKTAAIVLGAIFILVGVLGFIPNPIVGSDGIFMTNTAHNLVHLVSGAVLLAGAYTSFGPSLALKIIGVGYAIVAILGFVMSGDVLLGMIAINGAHHWLHVLLAILLLAAGFGLNGGMMKSKA